ncbi:hypothetical protein [Kochikohdavirus PBEF19]|uniref:Uncharacterized protein n=1 Tax=Enterococcus phage PBEF129 TaxID=2696337 RepID=A0A7T3JE78_9CAUD|nr:hypothetical protein [Enterococcus phage PBEF129]
MRKNVICRLECVSKDKDNLGEWTVDNIYPVFESELGKVYILDDEGTTCSRDSVSLIISSMASFGVTFRVAKDKAEDPIPSNPQSSTSLEIVKGYEHLAEFIDSLSSNQRVVSHSVDPISQWHYIIYETKSAELGRVTLEELLDTLVYNVHVVVMERSKRTYEPLENHTFKWEYGTKNTEDWEKIVPLLGCKVFNTSPNSNRGFHITILK